MGKSAAQNLAVKHAGNRYIANKSSRAGDFLDAVDALHVVPDEFKFSLGHALSKSKRINDS